MNSNTIEALYIIDQNNEIILEHVYRSRPPSARTLLPLYLSHPAPRPSLMYLPQTSPPTILFSIIHANLILFSPSLTEVEPLFILEFLHRLCDVLEEFLGAPLLASKIEGSYDVVAQLLSEMCDAGSICNTEPNALRDVVEMPGWVDKLLSGVGLQGPTSTQSPSLSSLRPSLSSTSSLSSSAPSIPWRRSSVRHTSNELYVDMIETLSVILSPSGRPLSAHASGSILFTAKISGIPDLLLTLSVPSGKHTLSNIIELPTFHPCVRLARWKSNPGELSFVPPDGRFLLAGYEVNLLPNLDWTSTSNASARNLNIPATVEVSTSIGPAGLEFEARLTLATPTASGSVTHSKASASNSGSSTVVSLTPAIQSLSLSRSQTPTSFSSSSTSNAPRPGFPAPRSTGPNLSALASGSGFFSSGNGSSGTPTLADVVVHIPFPAAVRNVLDLRASRGEAHFSIAEREVEWRLSTKDAGIGGTATLRGNVVGPLGREAGGVGGLDDLGLDGEGDRGDTTGVDATARMMGIGGGGWEEYDPQAEEEAQGMGYQSAGIGEGESVDTSSLMARGGKGKDRGKAGRMAKREERPTDGGRDMQRVEANKALMPRSAMVSFSVKGWLASGIRVESLVVDVRKSKGLGEGVRPVKGAKYLSISRRGVESRC